MRNKLTEIGPVSIVYPSLIILTPPKIFLFLESSLQNVLRLTLLVNVYYFSTFMQLMGNK